MTTGWVLEDTDLDTVFGDNKVCKKCAKQNNFLNASGICPECAKNNFYEMKFK